jgi:glucose-6-phosphate isomerase
LTPHRTYPGNVPSNIVWLPRLDAYHLGALVAAYEHKVFTQAAIWGIHAFDQWGVELGKNLVRRLQSSAS